MDDNMPQHAIAVPITSRDKLGPAKEDGSVAAAAALPTPNSLPLLSLAPATPTAGANTTDQTRFSLPEHAPRQASLPLSDTESSGHSEPSSSGAESATLAPFLLDEETRQLTRQTRASNTTTGNPQEPGSSSNLSRHPLLSSPVSPRDERRTYSSASVSTADAFSSLSRAPRPWRARYDDQRATSPDIAVGDRAHSQHAFKRAFDQVSPTTGTTPPAEHTPTAEGHLDAFAAPTSGTTTLVAAPLNSPLRHSFESQRATLSPRMRHVRESDGSSLRRRSPVTSRSGSRDRATRSPFASPSSVTGLPRDRSKRLRADSAGNDSMELDHEPVVSASTSASLSTSFAPALGRYPSRALPTDPVLVSTSQGRQSVAASQSSDAPLTRRPRLSFSSVSAFPSFSSFRRASASLSPSSAHQDVDDVAVGTTSSFSASPPPASTTLVMRPRSARVTSDRRAHDDIAQFLADGREQIRANEEFQAQSRAMLREAEAMLSRAQNLVDNAARDLHHFNQLDEAETRSPLETMSDEAEERRARMLQDLPSPDLPLPSLTTRTTTESEMVLPSTRHLPAPGELDERPVIGIRIGEGWTTRRASSQEQLSPTTEDASAVLSPASDATSGSSGSRAMRFLTNLRSRRPRLARNTTGVPPPEESPEVTSPEREGSGRLSHRHTNSLSGETGEALHRWSDILRVRAPAETSSSTVEALWGQVGGTGELLNDNSAGTLPRSGRRLRGPTERANALWRMGQIPAAALPSTTTTTHATALAQGPTSRSRQVDQSSVAGDSSFPAFNLRSRTQAITAQAEATSLPASPNPAPAMTRDRSGPPGERGHPTSPRRTTIFNSSSWEADRRRPTNDEPEQTSHERTTRIQAIRQPVRLQPRRSYASALRSGSRDESFMGGDSTSTRTRRNVLAGEVDDETEVVPDQAARFVGPPNMLPSGSAGRRAGPSAEVVTAAAAAGQTAANRRWSAQVGAHTFLASRLSRRLASESMPGRDTQADDEDSLEERILTRTRSLQALMDERRATRAREGASSEEQVQSNRRLLQRLVTQRRAQREAEDRELNLLRNRTRTDLATAGETSDSGATLRRRRTIYDPPGAALPPLEFDTVEGLTAAERNAARVERLAGLHRERSALSSLLLRSTIPDGTDPDDEILPEDAFASRSDSVRDEARPSAAGPSPMSPQTRRRSLGELFRGLGGMGGRWIAAWDDDFIGFFTRDSAALDPRNYQADDEFDDSYDALIRLSERLGDVKPKGLSVEKVSQLKTTKYRDWPKISSTTVQDPVKNAASTSQLTMDVDHDEDNSVLAKKGVDKEERCAVCLQDYEEDDDVMFGLCSHGFHEDCLKAWLKEHGTCPVCRRDHSQ
ncbi:hypothetical protein OIV83_002037 [Microbotryomycetes sp. JL201]|nr:hypothetical protein OIV83_002037 [Microbotryomycetes sp. JL201]